MPDWQNLIRWRLSGLKLDSAEKEEVHAELTGHLEESYEEFRREGLLENHAARRTLAQVSDWKDLQRKILAAKRRDPMQKRLHQLWVPGFLTLILSMIFLYTLQETGFYPRLVPTGPNTILFYGPWLMLLPAFGALGAYLSRRAGGSQATVLLASVFPVLALTTAFFLMFPIGWMAERIMGRPIDFGFVATSILRDGIGWIFLPGLALLMGGLLVQRLINRRSVSPDMAVD